MEFLNVNEEQRTNLNEVMELLTETVEKNSNGEVEEPKIIMVVGTGASIPSSLIQKLKGQAPEHRVIVVDEAGARMVRDKIKELQPLLDEVIRNVPTLKPYDHPHLKRVDKIPHLQRGGFRRERKYRG